MQISLRTQDIPVRVACRGVIRKQHDAVRGDTYLPFGLDAAESNCILLLRGLLRKSADISWINRIIRIIRTAFLLNTAD